MQEIQTNLVAEQERKTLKSPTKIIYELFMLFRSGQITQTYTQSTTTTEFYYYCYEDHTLPWRGGMLLTGQVKGLGPSGGAAACISWPLPVGVTVKHTRKT